MPNGWTNCHSEAPTDLTFIVSVLHMALDSKAGHGAATSAWPLMLGVVGCCP